MATTQKCPTSMQLTSPVKHRSKSENNYSHGFCVITIKQFANKELTGLHILLPYNHPCYILTYSLLLGSFSEKQTLTLQQKLGS